MCSLCFPSFTSLKMNGLFLCWMGFTNKWNTFLYECFGINISLWVWNLWRPLRWGGVSPFFFCLPDPNGKMQIPRYTVSFYSLILSALQSDDSLVYLLYSGLRRISDLWFSFMKSLFSSSSVFLLTFHLFMNLYRDWKIREDCYSIFNCKLVDSI